MFGFFKRKKAEKNVSKEDDEANRMIEQMFSAMQEQRKAPASALTRARYMIEHSLMKNYFFEDAKVFLETVTMQNGLYALYGVVMEKECGGCPYEKEQFKVESSSFDGGTLVCAQLPEPEAEPLCYRIYFVCDKSGDKNVYFTVEKGMGDAFICCWNGDNHMNCGKADSAVWGEDAEREKADEISKIIELFNHADNTAAK